MTPWAVVHQVPLSMGSSRQEYCSGLPFPSPGNFPDSGIEPGSPASQADSLLSEAPEGGFLSFESIVIKVEHAYVVSGYTE